MNENTGVVLCGANSYEQKYYFNPDFNKLPKDVKDELKIMCVSFTEEAGGIIIMRFDEAGNLKFEIRTDDADYMFDNIEAELKISKFQREKEKLLAGIELYYRMVFLGQGA